LLRTGDELTQSLLEDTKLAERGEVSSQTIERGYEILSRGFDALYGGFGSAPKFPTPHQLTFLLRYGTVNKNKTALAMVEKTLTQMYKGGIFDHLGLGFSRYSTDRKWLVPHFDKMLYDNALLTSACLETFQATGQPLFREVAPKIITYVLRDLTSSEGAFYSAEDADSEGVEGKFYVWRYEEVEKILGSEAARKFSQVYDISPAGNFEGESIPNLIKTDLDLLAGPEADFLAQCREKLFFVREKRVHPYKDDKILTAWNGLMIAALAMAGRILAEEGYTEAGRRAVDFILANLRHTEGRLLARYRVWGPCYPAYLYDFSCLSCGLL